VPPYVVHGSRMAAFLSRCGGLAVPSPGGVDGGAKGDGRGAAGGARAACRGPSIAVAHMGFASWFARAVRAGIVCFASMRRAPGRDHQAFPQPFAAVAREGCYLTARDAATASQRRPAAQALRVFESPGGRGGCVPDAHRCAPAAPGHREEVRPGARDAAYSGSSDALIVARRAFYLLTDAPWSHACAG
jgi:hypothetical protein